MVSQTVKKRVFLYDSPNDNHHNLGDVDNTGEPPAVGPEQDPFPKHGQPRRAPPGHRLHHQAQP